MCVSDEPRKAVCARGLGSTGGLGLWHWAGLREKAVGPHFSDPRAGGRVGCASGFPDTGGEWGWGFPGWGQQHGSDSQQHQLATDAQEEARGCPEVPELGGWTCSDREASLAPTQGPSLAPGSAQTPAVTASQAMALRGPWTKVDPARPYILTPHPRLGLWL